MSYSTATLIELRHHYETIIAQAQSQASQAKEQLAHIDALLLNGLLQGAMQTRTAVIAPEQPAPATALELDEAEEDSRSQAEPSPSREAKATPVPEPIPQGNRIPRPLLPEYQGMMRLAAIAKALQSNPGQDVSIDSLSQSLFGDLSASDRVLERKRLYTLLYKGEKLGLWIKGKTPYSYSISQSKTTKKIQSTSNASEPKLKASAARTKAAIAPHPESFPREKASLSLLPAYEGMTKLEAIAQVLTEQSGHVLHQDTIFQLLYGEVSPAVLNQESKRMRASLFQGVSKGLWDKSTAQTSSYLAKASPDRPPMSAVTTLSLAQSGRMPSVLGKETAIAPSKTASRGRTQVLSLPTRYTGLSKIETVAKLLEENKGKTMHMDEIIEHLYGTLSEEDLKAEKVRMKDVMTRGVQRQLWNKAPGVPSSIVAGEPKQRLATPETSSTSAKVTKLDPAPLKKPRKAASAQTTVKPKRKQAEVVALLKKANIKV
jgi:hypothetical protein